MTHTDKIFGAGKRDAERTPSDALKLSPAEQMTYPDNGGLPEQQKEDTRRRQESGQAGGDRKPDPVEKGDGRRHHGGPGQQGENRRPDAPEDKRRKRGSENN